MRKKCIALFSGGLDSVLAVKTIQEQGIEVIGVNFTSPFFSSGCARQAAKEIKLELAIIDISDEIIALVKKPKYGHGKNLNPCIDCHILMLKTARSLLKDLGASFIITGEVLNERPKSQTREALKIIEEESGNTGFLLRPLSAKLLKPTVPEEKGVVNRERLLAISGRSRRIQLELAERYNLKKYATPAGGCLLTDMAFCERLADALKHGEDKINDMNMLKLGRHFRVPLNGKIVVGRNEIENKAILELAREDDFIFEVKDVPGPITLLRGAKSLEAIEKAAKLTARYSDASGKKIRVFYGTMKEGFNRDIWVLI